MFIRSFRGNVENNRLSTVPFAGSATTKAKLLLRTLVAGGLITLLTQCKGDEFNKKEISPKDAIHDSGVIHQEIKQRLGRVAYTYMPDSISAVVEGDLGFTAQDKRNIYGALISLPDSSSKAMPKTYQGLVELYRTGILPHMCKEKEFKEDGLDAFFSKNSVELHALCQLLLAINPKLSISQDNEANISKLSEAIIKLNPLIFFKLEEIQGSQLEGAPIVPINSLNTALASTKKGFVFPAPFSINLGNLLTSDLPKFDQSERYAAVSDASGKIYTSKEEIIAASYLSPESQVSSRDVSAPRIEKLYQYYKSMNPDSKLTKQFVKDALIFGMTNYKGSGPRFADPIWGLQMICFESGGRFDPSLDLRVKNKKTGKITRTIGINCVKPSTLAEHIYNSTILRKKYPAIAQGASMSRDSKGRPQYSLSGDADVAYRSLTATQQLDFINEHFKDNFYPFFVMAYLENFLPAAQNELRKEYEAIMNRPGNNNDKMVTFLTRMLDAPLLTENTSIKVDPRWADIIDPGWAYYENDGFDRLANNDGIITARDMLEVCGYKDPMTRPLVPMRFIGGEHQITREVTSKWGAAKDDFSKVILWLAPGAERAYYNANMAYYNKYKCNLPIISAYRTDETQHRLTKKNQNANENSWHEWGLAIDIPMASISSAKPYLLAHGFIQPFPNNPQECNHFIYERGRVEYAKKLKIKGK